MHREINLRRSPSGYDEPLLSWLVILGRSKAADVHMKRNLTYEYQSLEPMGTTSTSDFIEMDKRILE